MDQDLLGSLARRWAICLSIVVIIIGLEHTVGFFPVRGILERLLMPVVQAAEKVTIVLERPRQAWDYSVEGTDHILKLQQQLAHQTVDRQRLLDLEQENEFLRELAQVEPSTQGGVMASVTLIDDQLWLNLGQAAEVSPGMVVVDQQGVLVGVIDQLGRYQARVKQPTELGFSTTVNIRDGAASGVALGDGVAVRLTQVLQTETIQAGDLVLTSGQDGLLPAGLLIGIVAELMSAEAQVTQEARLTPVSNVTDGALVVVLK